MMGHFLNFIYIYVLRKIILLSTYIIELKKNPFLLTINLVLKFVGQKFDNKKSQSKSIILVETKIIEHYIIDKKRIIF
jgi:hypothetical protein